MFLEVFSKICEERNFSANAVAKEIGVSNSTTTKWKRGAIPESQTLIKLSDYFGVSIDYLLGRTEQTTQTINNQESNKGIQAHTYNAGTREKEYDDVSEQLLKEFKKLSLKDKSEAIRIICEMTEKEN